ncbi:DUF721 domain-containing protein [Limibaculum sp. M0105]|uniref:DUF721 domain-containing protein n=1 Tax=Thermohalobaculum xanthum TaxID=2753746 RepID=A0A8J7M975_9RHOB|nr:DciA family protein [Thermohalobaculum xanthum]MBK0401014.1 DUF721 domain-containing protein [Thermohalobaculum xanthum]
MASAVRGGKGSGRGLSSRGRGRGGFRAAGAAVTPGVVPLAEKQGFAESAVLLRWPEIVGAALSALCHPVKVSYGRGAELGATLLVRAEGPAALEVEHRAPQILERINAHYGYRAIARIRITQGTGLAGEAQPGFAEGATPFDADAPSPGRARPAPNPWRGEAREPAPVTSDARARAEQLARTVQNPALRDALSRMGAFVLSRPARPKPTE